jgi:hypothetical protein
MLMRMKTARDDLVELSDYAWRRFRRRMDGLTDEEYFWEPVPNCATVRPGPGGVFRVDRPSRPSALTTLAWRLCHIIGFLQEDRNATWLGQPGTATGVENGDGYGEPAAPGGAEEALIALEGAYITWDTLLAATTDESLGEPIGEVGGQPGRGSRRSFVLHVLDQLIHHGAEAALLRDLYAARSPAPPRPPGRPG